jgi:hypothetical protein
VTLQHDGNFALVVPHFFKKATRSGSVLPG